METTSVSDRAVSLSNPDHVGGGWPEGRLRKARADEFASLHRLQLRARNRAWDCSTWKTEIERSQSVIWVLAADTYDELCAAIVLWRTLQGLEIAELIVDPGHRRKSIATGLVQMAIAVAGANGIQQMVLEVREKNEAAISLYGKLGFQCRGRRNNFYQNGDAALSMDLLIVDS